MAKRIYFFDTTLRDGEQSPGCSMNKREKLLLARQLEKMGVDVIEAGFAAASPGDFESVKLIADEIRTSTVCVLARTVKDDIDKAWAAVQGSARPRIHTFIATSPIHMEYKLKMSPEQVLERAEAMVGYAASLCPEVEFSAEDATRSDVDFLALVFDRVIAAGAKIINIPDTVGYTTPDEFYHFIQALREKSRLLDTVRISVHCHDDLGLGVANSIAAISAGAAQVECTVSGIGERAGNAALEEIAMILKLRSDLLDTEIGIVTEEITRTSSLLSSITGVHVQPNKAIVGANAFAHESGIHQHGVLANRATYEIMTPESVGLAKNNMVLGKHSGRHAFRNKARELGYDLSPDELNAVFEEFKELADRKKEIFDRDIETLLTQGMQDHHNYYKLKRFVVNSGNTITTTASVVVAAGGVEREGISFAQGPIDATFRAIEQVIDVDVALEDFSLQSVTEGTDALGYATVTLRHGDRHFIGRDASINVVQASIGAWLNAMNKVMHAIETDKGE